MIKAEDMKQALNILAALLLAPVAAIQATESVNGGASSVFCRPFPS
jgi:hypothetical protein